MKVSLQESIQINKSSNLVFDIISDLNHWNTWSPWFHCEPSSKTEIYGEPSRVGQKQTWIGKIIGEGSMTLTELTPPSKINIELNFLKPFKSQALVEFNIESQQSDTCSVQWKMSTDMPWILFFIKKSMVAFMQRDFRRGLLMLKEFCETQNVLSRSRFLGEIQSESMTVIGKDFYCKISELDKHMDPGFRLLMDLNAQKKIPNPDHVVSLTHNFDLINNKCFITTGFAYKNLSDSVLPEGLVKYSYPSHKTLAADHFGHYRHLANVWAMVMSHQRVLKKQINSKLPLYEVYLNMPGTVPESDIHTRVHVPLK